MLRETSLRTLTLHILNFNIYTTVCSSPRSWFVEQSPTVLWFFHCLHRAACLCLSTDCQFVYWRVFSVTLSAGYIVMPEGGDEWLSLWVIHWSIHLFNLFKTPIHLRMIKVTVFISQWTIHLTDSFNILCFIQEQRKKEIMHPNMPTSLLYAIVGEKIVCKINRQYS